jgi:hypothetical protein
MAHSFTGDDKFRDLSYDDDYRSYLISRRDSPGGYRFARTQMRRDRIRVRNAFRRVNGFLKTMIEAIANSKVRRIRFDRDTDNWVVRDSGPREGSR